MNKLYTLVVSYNPTENRITGFRRINIESDYYDRESDEVFFRLLALANRTTDIILGKTIGGDFFQLSPTPYGSYIKEDNTTVRRFINKSKLLCAIAKYQKEKNIPFER